MKKLDIIKRQVADGRCEIYENWKQLADISEICFTEAVEWLLADPENGGHSGAKMTREVGLTPSGIVRLERLYSDIPEELCTFVDISTRKQWDGAVFTVPCDNPAYADADGMTKHHMRLSISARDTLIAECSASSGAALAELRKHAKLTQAQLANAAGITQQMVGRFESGKADLSNATGGTLIKLADALGCTLDELVGRQIR